ncbi:liver-expressed antimicrobial peptide 2-like [Toxotes jaculatrix]|uniref:liver-expressed antimicrobial peptide 2-like n=1 Tax=Toxotes jaculatrix TaxID=941984 RepID=UPI001B3B0E6F|nr:liver-expressed antimicrobial peptide 2-like [Toxotes jaculatrix]
MRTLQGKIIVVLFFVSVICATQVNSVPLAENWNGLIQRTKRSLLWRWNSMKPVGASCRDHMECGTKYCRKNICSFWRST